MPVVGSSVRPMLAIHGRPVRADERELDLEHLLSHVGDVVHLVHPHLATGAGDGLVAALLDQPDQVVVGWHGALFRDVAEPRFDSEELAGVLFEFVLQLGAPEDEHALKLLERHPIHEPPGLDERQPEFLQGHDPVELSQLRGRVAAVPGERVDLGRRSSPISS